MESRAVADAHPPSAQPAPQPADGPREMPQPKKVKESRAARKRDPEQSDSAPQTDPPRETTPETALARGLRLLAVCKPADVGDLRQSILEELSGADVTTWHKACDQR